MLHNPKGKLKMTHNYKYADMSEEDRNALIPAISDDAQLEFLTPPIGITETLAHLTERNAPCTPEPAEEEAEEDDDEEDLHGRWYRDDSTGWAWSYE